MRSLLYNIIIIFFLLSCTSIYSQNSKPCKQLLNKKEKVFVTKEAKFKILNRNPIKEIDFPLNKVDGFNNELIARGEEPIRYRSYRNGFNGLEFKFSDISETRFLEIAELYGNHTRSAPKKGNNDYMLLDFMPPLVQALHGHALEYGSESVSSINKNRTGNYSSVRRQIDQDVGTSTNCFSTALELARRGSFIDGSPPPSKFTVSFVDRFQIQNILSQYGNLVKNIEANNLDALLKNKEASSDIATGTTMLFLVNHQLLRNVEMAMNGKVMSSELGEKKDIAEHAVTYIDKNLIFEKVNADDADPYRFASVSDAAKPYFAEKNKVRVQYFDFSQALPPAQTVQTNFNSAVSEAWKQPLPKGMKNKLSINREISMPSEDRDYNTWSQILDLPIIRDPQTGRYNLSNSAYNPQTFRIEHP